MEQREATIYVRSKKPVKRYLLWKMSQDGWKNFTAWFEEFITEMMKADRKYQRYLKKK